MLEGPVLKESEEYGAAPHERSQNLFLGCGSSRLGQHDGAFVLFVEKKEEVGVSSSHSAPMCSSRPTGPIDSILLSLSRPSSPLTDEDHWRDLFDQF
jgi:hypothetical protein